MTVEQQTKIDKMGHISMTFDVYLTQAEVDIEVQGESINVTVEDIEGEAEVYLNTRNLDQLNDLELHWLKQTCRELIAGRE